MSSSLILPRANTLMGKFKPLPARDWFGGTSGDSDICLSNGAPTQDIEGSLAPKVGQLGQLAATGRVKARV